MNSALTRIGAMCGTPIFTAWYPFVSDASDASGYGNDGTLEGGATVSGGELVLDAAGEYMSCAVPVSVPCTISAWMNTWYWSDATERAIACSTTSFGGLVHGLYTALAPPSSFRINASWGGQNIYYATGPPFSGWHMVSMVVTASKLELFLDGVSVADNTAGAPFGGTATIQYVGGTDGGNFDANMDDVRIYPYAISADRLLSIYNEGRK